MFFTGNPGCVIRMQGCCVIGTTGSNALRTSNGTRRVAPTIFSVSVPANSVYPSGAARALISVATMVPPPVRLSTTTVCPQRSVSICATVRLIMSRPPPGTDETMMRIGRSG